VVAQVVLVVADVVKRQVEIGLDCIGDGEYWVIARRAHSIGG